MARQNGHLSAKYCQLERGLISLYELKDWIWAVPGPKNIMIWIFVTQRLDELLKTIGDRIKITHETAEKIVKM
eukprot:3302498-Ditylum_brightwellii.AAC.1